MFLEHSKSPDSPEYLNIKIPPKYPQMGKKWHLKPLYLVRTQTRQTVDFYSIINLYLLAQSSKKLIFYSIEEEISLLIIPWPCWYCHGYYCKFKKNNNNKSFNTVTVFFQGCRLFSLLPITWQSLREKTWEACLWAISMYLLTSLSHSLLGRETETRVKKIQVVSFSVLMVYPFLPFPSFFASLPRSYCAPLSICGR